MPFAFVLYFGGKAVNVPYADLMYVIKKVKVLMIITKKIMMTRMIQYCYAVHGVPYAGLMYVVLWDHTSHTLPPFR